MKKFSGYYVQIVNLGTPDRKVLISTGVGALLSAGGPGLDRRRLAPAAWSFPPGPGRGSGRVLRTLRVVAAFSVPRGAAPRGPRLPGGGPHFSREMGRKRAGGKPPGPPVLWPARCHSLILAWWGALFRSMGYYGAHLCALIWDASSCRAAQPGGFPLGGSCHRRGRMRGRSCTQPFLVEGGACRPDAFLLPPRWVSRSPPHPTRLRRPTFPPRGRLWTWELPCRASNPSAQ